MTPLKKKQWSTLAIIPARGGSKSIPLKNIYPLCGKPLISYVIRAVKESRYVNRLIVSTDDIRIAEVARRCGAEVPFMRPPEFAQDTTPSISVITHALDWLEKNDGYRPDYVLFVQPTEPFVKPKQIDAVFELMVSKNADSGITAVRVPRVFHPYHVRRITDDGYLEFVEPELHYAHPTRQSDPPRFAFGNLYWFRRDLFMKEQKIEVGKRVAVEIDPFTAHDINEKSDIVFAEYLLREGLV